MGIAIIRARTINLPIGLRFVSSAFGLCVDLIGFQSKVDVLTVRFDANTVGDDWILSLAKVRDEVPCNLGSIMGNFKRSITVIVLFFFFAGLIAFACDPTVCTLEII